MNLLKSFATVALFTAVLHPVVAGAAVKPITKEAAAKEIVVLDKSASTMTWLGKKVKGEHQGAVTFKEGSFEMQKGLIKKGEVVVDLTTITNTDLTDADYNKKLVNHLKSEDFFYVEKFPTATFKIQSFSEIAKAAKGSPNAIAKGTLTVRGVTNPAEMKVTYVPSKDGFDATGVMEIDRTKFGVKYSSKKFFSMEKLGDKMIDDKFQVTFHLVAKKK